MTHIYRSCCSQSCFRDSLPYRQTCSLVKQDGLGAILSQLQEDGKLHPLAYATRSLSKSEKNYPVTDLEMLAVVWGVTHFRYYLYGHQMTIYTNHAAVKAVLGTPNLTGKHAHW